MGSKPTSHTFHAVLPSDKFVKKPKYRWWVAPGSTVKYRHRLSERDRAEQGSLFRLLDQSRGLNHECDEDWHPTKKAKKPTKHLPGTPGKIDVLAARMLAGEELWHPDDAEGSYLEIY